MRLLITSDLHLTDRGEHAYRWELFRCLRGVLASEPFDALAVLGDVTDRKDNHSSALVHQILGSFRSLGTPVILLKGNHDYVEEGAPFLDWLADLDPAWEWYSNPAHVYGDAWGRPGVVLLPHTRDPERAWAPLRELQPRLVLGHATITGSRAESGVLLDGIRREWLPRAPVTVLGDVHVPQQLTSDLWYVGSPYHVRFGRVNYEPRFLVVEWSSKSDPAETRVRSIPTGLARRVIVDVRDPADLDQLPPMRPEDRMRIVVHQGPGTTPESWRAVADAVAARVDSSTEIVPLIEQPDLVASDTRDASRPEELFHAYCEQKGFETDDVVAGFELLRGLIDRPD